MAQNGSKGLAKADPDRNSQEFDDEAKPNKANHQKRPKTAKNGCFLSITRQDFTFRSRNLVLGGGFGGPKR